MGGELGVPGRSPQFRPQRPNGGSGGLAPRFRPRHTKGGPRACPPVYATTYKGGRFRPQRLELTHFVTGCYFFFLVFHAFRNLYIPHPKPSFSV